MSKKALISVSDKRGLVDFAKGLIDLKFEIISTGGTSKLLKNAGIKVTEISEYTGFPEILGGRVKTLHPKVYAGVLARSDVKEHQDEIKKLNIEPINLIVVNLYPFQDTIKKQGVTQEEAIENIDIGGPTMLRAGSKNYESVGVIVNPDWYPEILKELQNNNGELNLETKFKLACEVFHHTSIYDSAIYNYFTSIKHFKH